MQRGGARRARPALGRRMARRAASCSGEGRERRESARDCARKSPCASGGVRAPHQRRCLHHDGARRGDARRVRRTAMPCTQQEPPS
jgi:hypothetical protein